NCESYAGEGALRIQTSAGGWSQTRVQLPEPVNEGELHARFWAKVSSALPLPEFLIFFELWNAPEVSDDKISVELLENSGLRLNLGPNGSVHGGDAASFPLDEWVCVELALAIGTNGSARLSIDSTPVADVSGVITLPAL